ncbi:MAG: phage tail tube protein [Nocardioides sp.]
MGRVITNGTTLSVAREASLGVLPGSPQWYELEPNGITSWGTTISKEARSPISQARARRKGVVTDLDSAVEFEADLTLTHLRIFAEAFLFSRAVGADAFLTSAATATGYTIPALTAAQAARLIYVGAGAGAVSLVYASGFINAANNGISPVTAAHAAAATEIKVAGNVAEAPAADRLIEVAVAGVRGAAGDIKVNAQGNITSLALDFTTLGLSPGQVIHVGGLDISNQFFNDANTGFVRVRAIAANLLTIDKRDVPFAVDDGTDTGAAGTPVRIDLLFGQFVRNVHVNHVDWREHSSQFELSAPNLMPGGLTGYEYSLGNYADAMSIAIPLAGKATVTFGFVGTDTLHPNTIRATNAAVAKVGGQTESFGSASDIARLRAQDVDEAGLTTDFKSATFTLTNNVAGEKVIGRLGPKYLNVGNIEVDVETQVLFTNPDVIERIRCNRTIGLDWIMRNGDGGVAFDLPTGTLDGGGRELPANQSVLLNGTFLAHEEDVHGYTMGMSFFPVLPARACA